MLLNPNAGLLACPRCHGSRRSQEGSSLVEYAFILILFFSLIFGISGFGHALYVYHAVNNAAKEGTRWAAVNGYSCNDDSSCNGTNGMNSGAASSTDISTYVTTQLPASLDQTLVRVIPTWTAPSGSPDVCTKSVAKSDGSGNIGPLNNYPGCTVSVQVSYPYNFNFPLIPAITTRTAPCASAGLCLSSTSEMVISH
jgi:Flp pilus assembly protein TadG